MALKTKQNKKKQILLLKEISVETCLPQKKIICKWIMYI